MPLVGAREIVSLFDWQQFWDPKVSFIIDHPDQLENIHLFKQISSHTLQIFIRIDTGYRRTALAVKSNQLLQLALDLFDLESSGTVHFAGFYSHAGHSYNGSSTEAALSLLLTEIQDLHEAATQANPTRNRRTILSVGVTPTATSNLTLLQPVSSLPPELYSLIAQLTTLITKIQETHTLKLHARVHPFLDLQQLAIYARPSLSTVDLALTILTEVVSLHTTRSPPRSPYRSRLPRPRSRAL